jgi:beta-lactamase regulating signal transducer with metallopeptidase domain
MIIGIIIFIVGLISLITSSVYTIVMRIRDDTTGHKTTGGNKASASEATAARTTTTKAKSGLNGILSILWIIAALGLGTAIGCYCVWVASKPW